jgi:hypothetical protein
MFKPDFVLVLLVLCLASREPYRVTSTNTDVTDRFIEPGIPFHFAEPEQVHHSTGNEIET